MSKPANSDILNLFSKFGGQAEGYREIKRDIVEDRAQRNWPIIAAMKNDLGGAPLPNAQAASSRMAQASPSLLRNPAPPVSSALSPSALPASRNVVAEPSRGLFTSLAAEPQPERMVVAPAASSALFGQRNVDAPREGGLFAALSAPQPEGPKPASMLFGQRNVAENNQQSAGSPLSFMRPAASAPTVPPSPAATPLQSLFAAKETASQTPQPASPLRFFGNNQTTKEELVQSQPETSLGSVFSRLLNPVQPAMAVPQSSGLRDMFSRLK